MQPVFKAVCCTVLMFETLGILWFAKLIAQEDGIDSFADGVHAVIHTLSTGW